MITSESLQLGLLQLWIGFLRFPPNVIKNLEVSKKLSSCIYMVFVPHINSGDLLFLQSGISIYSKLPIVWQVWIMSCANYVNEKIIYRNTIQDKTSHFCYSFYVGVCLGDRVDLWVNDFGYIHCNTITASARLYCNGNYMREDNV
jgi:hypothetical protein